ncbi:Kazal-type serine protease inhibitor domain-containing protein [Agrobacterium cavarae]|uniref:Kazal-type serine protease inhibitor domain-containing protein n=1 Tax=Agrobacterium cavarae TaxID=2528239 RepID=UPI003A5218A6
MREDCPENSSECGTRTSTYISACSTSCKRRDPLLQILKVRPLLQYHELPQILMGTKQFIRKL